MLKELLKAITGSVQTTAFTYPSGNGIKVSPQATFGKMFNNLLGAFTGNPANTFNPMQGYSGQVQNYNSASQAYANSLAGGQGFSGAAAYKPSQREAFAPGAVITSLQAPPLPQTLPDPYSQIGQLTGAINPLQGFANSQVGGAIPGAVTGTFGAGSLIPGQAMPGAYGLPGGYGMPTSSGLGKWSMLLMPLIGVVNLVKSFFGLRGIANSMQPVQIDKDAVDYKIALDNYTRGEHTEGSFDNDYWGEESIGEDSGFDSSKLEM